MNVDCPYCSCDALIRLVSTGAFNNPDEVYFKGSSIHNPLNSVKWQAYTCGVCKRTSILDEEAVEEEESE